MTTETSTLLGTAHAYWDAGLTPMPRVTGYVEPSYIDDAGAVYSIAWGEYKVKQPDWSTVQRWFTRSDPETVGMLLLTGSHAHPRADHAAYLQILDIESPALVEAFLEEVHYLGHSAILHRCVIERTPPNNGHIGFRCRAISSAQKIMLARGQDKKILFELLQHQPCTVTPTAIQCKPTHPEGIAYRLEQATWEQVHEISPEQRQILLDVARSFNELPEKTAKEKHGKPIDGIRPGDLLNEQADIDWWQELLTRHDWREVSRPGLRSRGVYYFQRPGKIGNEPSATYGKTGQSLYVFSSNAQPFEPDTAYRPFAAYAYLDHDGNFPAAAKALTKAYGLDGAHQAQQEAQRWQNGHAPTTDAEPGTEQKPSIKITTDMQAIVNAAQQAIFTLPDGPQLFQRARQLCFVAYDVPSPQWLIRPPDLPVILPATTARLTELAATAAAWLKYDKRQEAWVSALPPAWMADMLASRGQWTFPTLEGIIYAPTLRRDGSILDTPGYDSATGLLLTLNGIAYPPIPHKPSLDDARSALGILQEPLIDFPFADKHDFSAAIAYIVTPLLRHAIAGPIPLGGISANTPASGKGLLADVISMIGTGRSATKWPQVSEEEEERKRLLSIGMAGYPLVCIDNVTRALGSPALDLALTSLVYSDRTLGVTQGREVPMTCVFLATGNNLTYKGDLLRRVVPIDLFSTHENPEARTDFRHPRLLEWVTAQRPRLVVAALTLVRAFFAADCPAQQLPPIGSYEAWSDVIRQTLVWAGEADPAAGRAELVEELADGELAQFRTLIEAWHSCYKPTLETSRTLKNVVTDIQNKAAKGKRDEHGKSLPLNEWDELRDALGAFDTRYDGQTLHTITPAGYALRRYKGRLFAGKYFVPDPHEVHGATQWVLRVTK